jgi:hypothetical protein
LTKEQMNRASDAATTTSDAAAIDRPLPATTPSVAAMTGFSA